MVLLCLIIFIFVAVPISLLVAYIVWMVKTWRRGRKRLFWSQMGVAVIAVAALGFMMDITPASHWFWERQRMKDISGRTADWTGVSFAFAKKVFLYDSERCWNGDGRTVMVLELPPEMRRYFSAPPPAFFAQYPQKTAAYGKDYQIAHWRSGAPGDDEKKILDFAFVQGGYKEMAQLEKTFAAARHALTKPTTYYAYLYRYPGHVGDVDLYVIDPEEGLFYLINLNT